ncbi:Gfo/Idh/MocA family protein [Lentzea sp. NPDC060358]|uniref:Gfo/Idh/MocA family protein n=1 Tax=Lentzea sp. NPDC060358 TaxID=3347103 RepID=UPI0036483331
MRTVTAALRFGVLGCAEIAWRRTLPSLVSCEDARLVVVASRDADKAARFASRFGCEAAHGYESVLERDDVDAVYLPLPTGLHREWCAKALRAGKHVLVEKPVAVDHQEALELATLAERHGVALLENRGFAHHTQHDAVRKLVADGVIGELRGFTSTMGIPPPPRHDVRHRADLGGGALLDVGYYPVSAAQLFVHQDLRVLGAHLVRDDETGVDVSGEALLVSPNGVPAHLSFGMRHAYRTHYELWGSKGRIVLERPFSAPDHWQPVVRLERQDRSEQLTLPPCAQFTALFRAFATAVRSDPAHRAAHLDPSVRAAALLTAIRDHSTSTGTGDLR